VGAAIPAWRDADPTIGVVEVDLDSGVGFVLPHDLESTPKPKPWVALLPALDPTTMGWQAREWYLGAHKDALFDRNGNAGPTIWGNGRIVGGWAIRKSGEVGHQTAGGRRSLGITRRRSRSRAADCLARTRSLDRAISDAARQGAYWVVTASVRTSRTLRARATESYGLLKKATSDCSAASVSRSVG
jgi:hypothetical protein